MRCAAFVQRFLKLCGTRKPGWQLPVCVRTLPRRVAAPPISRALVTFRAARPTFSSHMHPGHDFCEVPAGSSPRGRAPFTRSGGSGSDRATAHARARRGSADLASVRVARSVAHRAQTVDLLICALGDRQSSTRESCLLRPTRRGADAVARRAGARPRWSPTRVRPGPRVAPLSHCAIDWRSAIMMEFIGPPSCYVTDLALACSTP